MYTYVHHNRILISTSCRRILHLSFFPSNSNRVYESQEDNQGSSDRYVNLLKICHQFRMIKSQWPLEAIFGHQSCCPEKISFLSASDRQNRQEDSNLRSMTKLESSNPCVRSSSASTRRREMPQQKDPYPGRSPLQCHTITWNSFHQFSLPRAFNYSCDWSPVTGCPLESYIPGCYRRYMKHTMVARDAFDQNYPAETYKTTLENALMLP